MTIAMTYAARTTDRTVEAEQDPTSPFSVYTTSAVLVGHRYRRQRVGRACVLWPAFPV